METLHGFYDGHTFRLSFRKKQLSIAKVRVPKFSGDDEDALQVVVNGDSRSFEIDVPSVAIAATRVVLSETHQLFDALEDALFSQPTSFNAIALQCAQRQNWYACDIAPAAIVTLVDDFFEQLEETLMQRFKAPTLRHCLENLTSAFVATTERVAQARTLPEVQVCRLSALFKRQLEASTIATATMASGILLTFDDALQVVQKTSGAEKIRRL